MGFYFSIDGEDEDARRHGVAVGRHQNFFLIFLLVCKSETSHSGRVSMVGCIHSLTLGIKPFFSLASN